MAKYKLKEKCASTQPANCVDPQVTLPEWSELECPSQSEVNQELYDKLTEIEELIDVSSITSTCIDYEADKTLLDVLTAHQEKIDALLKKCEMCDDCPSCDDTDEGSTPTFNPEEILIADWGIDLSCLTNPCGDGIDTLQDLLAAIVTKIKDC